MKNLQSCRLQLQEKISRPKPFGKILQSMVTLIFQRLQQSYCNFCFILVNPTNLMEKITSADSKGKRDKVEKILCGVAKLLYDNRAKAPDPLIFSSLLQLAQENSSYFQSETVTEVNFTAVVIL